MALNVGEIKAFISLEAKSFFSKIQQVGTAVNKTAKDILASTTKMEKSLKVNLDKSSKSYGNFAKSAEKASARISSQNQKIASSMGKLKVALGSIAAVGLTKSLADMSRSVDAAEKRLRFVTGSAEGAAAKFAELSELGNKLGVSTKALADSYGGFAAAAKGTKLEGEKAESLFEAMSKASSVLGLTSDQTAGSMYALSQMMSSGTVRAEELFLQLGDRLPGAARVFADAIGVSQMEMRDLMQKGLLPAVEVLPKVTKELNNVFSAESEKNADGLTASITRMDNALTDLAKTFTTETAEAQKTFFNAITSGIESVNSLLKKTTDQLKQAKEFRKSLEEETKGDLPFGLHKIRDLFGKGEVGQELQVIPAEVKVEDETDQVGWKESFKKMSSSFKKGLESIGFGSVVDDFKEKVLEPIEVKIGDKIIITESPEMKEKIDDFYKAFIIPEDIEDAVKDKAERLIQSVVGGSKDIAQATSEIGEFIANRQETLAMTQEQTSKKILEANNALQENNELMNRINTAGYEMLSSTIRTASDALTDFIMTGKFDFQDMVKSMLAQIQKLIVEFFILKPLLASFSNFTGFTPSSGGSSGSVAFAKGGVLEEPVVGVGLNSGKKYTLGEEGPEAVVPLDGEGSEKKSRTETKNNNKENTKKESGFSYSRELEKALYKISSLGEEKNSILGKEKEVESDKYLEKISSILGKEKTAEPDKSLEEIRSISMDKSFIEGTKSLEMSSKMISESTGEKLQHEFGGEGSFGVGQQKSGTSGGGGANININISAIDSKSLAQLMRDNPSAITGPISEALQMGDRGLSSAIRGVM